MAGFLNRFNLELYITDIIHRGDIPSSGNGFNYRSIIELATQRIGQELRSNANAGNAAIDPDAGQTRVYTLPTDFVELRTVTTSDSGLSVTLVPLSASDVDGFVEEGHPIGYSLGSLAVPTEPSALMALQVVPANGATINIEYWQDPAELTNQGNTNPVLQLHGSLYLYCTMTFVTQWTQSFEQSQYWEGLYQAELARINSESNKARYGVGLHRGPSARFYNNTPSRAM